MVQPTKYASGIYYLRRKVPAELRSIVGMGEYKKSLDTKDWNEAKTRFAVELVACDKLFANARAQLAGQDTITPAQAERLAAEWFRDEQERLELSKAFATMLGPVGGGFALGPDGEDIPPDYDVLNQAYLDSEGVEMCIAELVEPHIEKTLARHSLPMPPKDAAICGTLRAAFGDQFQRLSEWALERQNGKWAALAVRPQEIAPEAAKRLAAGTASGIKLSQLFELYSVNKISTDGSGRAAVKTVGEFKAVVRCFIDLFGDLDVKAIDRALAQQFRTELMRLPKRGRGFKGLSAKKLIEKADAENLPRIAAATVANKVGGFQAVLSQGVVLGVLTENPVVHGAVRRNAKKAAIREQVSAGVRREYTTEELKAIFAGRVFTERGWQPGGADFGEAWYWAPLLFYYTGARLEEIAQLLAKDVRLVDDIWCINILAAKGEADGERSVKNRRSRRYVPVHSDLIARGLIGYAASLPPEGQLFPKLVRSPTGRFGTNFAKRWGEYLRDTLKVVSPAKPSHGFRHSFKTLGRGASMDLKVLDVITGHADGSVGSSYGSMPVQRMADELEKLPRVDDLK